MPIYNVPSREFQLQGENLLPLSILVIFLHCFFTRILYYQDTISCSRLSPNWDPILVNLVSNPSAMINKKKPFDHYRTTIIKYHKYHKIFPFRCIHSYLRFTMASSVTSWWLLIFRKQFLMGPGCFIIAFQRIANRNS